MASQHNPVGCAGGYNNPITNFMIDHITDTAIIQLHKHITNIILLTPAMQRFIFINSTVVTDNSVHFKFTERERAYIPHIYLKPNRLTASQIEIFNETWCMGDFVEITNAKLVLKPFRREPP